MIISCIHNDFKNNNLKFSVGYIDGGYEGLLLNDYLTSNLESFKMSDKKSALEIRANISHDTALYITNIDNTSRRERVTSKINVRVFNKNLECAAYNVTEKITQYYIFASNDKFISNSKALQQIKIENTEELVKKLINSLMYAKVNCVE